MDLIIIVLLLSIIAMIGLPSFNSALADYTLSGAAEEVFTALEYAKLTATNSGVQTKVTIDDTSDTILVEKFTPNADFMGSETELAEADVENGAFLTMEKPMNRGIDYDIQFADEGRFSGVDISSSVFGSGNFVIFNAFGTPSDGGTVLLSLGDRQAVVSVDDITGKVTVSS